jgi:hypothetical protein
MPANQSLLDDIRREKAKLRMGTESHVPSPETFRRTVNIDANGQTIKFVPDPWQEDDFRAMDPAWMEIAGHGPPAKMRRAWHERPRGHSKTSDLALMVSWVLTYADRPIRGVAAASSKEQASILRDFIGTLCRLNAEIASALEINNWKVINRKTGTVLEILSSDVSASWGELVDFVVCDEVSHWPEGRGEKFWESLFTTAGKRERCLLVTIMNAGFTESWVWKVRESIRKDANWHFSHLDGVKASWLTPKNIKEQRAHLPPMVFDRLVGNVWSVGSGDAITEADLQASLVRQDQLAAAEPGWEYYGGVDLSVSRDHSALVIIGKSAGGRLRLARVMDWAPPSGGKIDLAVVRRAIEHLDKIFHASWHLDPYQGELLAQELQKQGIVVEMVPFTGSSLVEMASGMVEAFSSRAIELYPDAQLVADLRKLRIVEGPSGWRLSAPRTAAGHCDRATALSLACLGARRAATFMEGEFLTDVTQNAFYRMPADVYPDQNNPFSEQSFGEPFDVQWG